MMEVQSLLGPDCVPEDILGSMTEIFRTSHLTKEVEVRIESLSHAVGNDQRRLPGSFRVTYGYDEDFGTAEIRRNGVVVVTRTNDGPLFAGCDQRFIIGLLVE